MALQKRQTSSWFPRWHVWRVYGAFPRKAIARPATLSLGRDDAFLSEFIKIPRGRPLRTTRDLLVIRIGNYTL
jgi:hypothetical protein